MDRAHSGLDDLGREANQSRTRMREGWMLTEMKRTQRKRRQFMNNYFQTITIMVLGLALGCQPDKPAESSGPKCRCRMRVVLLSSTRMQWCGWVVGVLKWVLLRANRMSNRYTR